MRRAAVAVVASLAAYAAPRIALAATETYPGVWALAGASKPVAASATLTLERTGPLSAQLDIVERRGNTIVRGYALDMTKRMHLIVVGAGFGSFAHDHPTLDDDGHLQYSLTVPAHGLYYVYADATPTSLGKTVYRFDVRFGGPAVARAVVPAPTAKAVAAGPYRVSLDSVRFSSARTTALHVSVEEHGRPARDLHPYLGGAAHAVFIDTATLAYLHVHPQTGSGSPMAGMGAMGGAGAMAGATMDMDEPALPATAHIPPRMTLQIGHLPPGRYALWLQFRGGTTPEVAPFVVTVTP